MREYKAEAESLCCELLSNGFCDSFQSFFELTCSPLTNPLTLDELSFVKETLETAEKQTMKAEYKKSSDSYMILGNHFRDRKTPKEAAKFYEKTKHIVETQTKKRDDKLQVYDELASIYMTMKEYDKSVENRRKHINCCEKGKNSIDIHCAYGELHKTYRLKAGELQQSKKYVDALEAYELSISTSKEANLLLGEGEVWFEMGKLHEEMDSNKAIECYRKYLKIGFELENDEAQSQAYYALGSAYKRNREIVLAHKYFGAYLESSKRGESLEHKCQALGSMGEILSQLNEYDKAKENLSQNYQLCRKLEDPEKTTNSAIKLGVVNGRQTFEQFAKKLVENNKSELLEWRSKRKNCIKSVGTQNEHKQVARSKKKDVEAQIIERAPENTQEARNESK